MLRLLTLLLAGTLCSAAHAQCGTGSTAPFQAFTVASPALAFSPPGVAEFDRGWSTVSHYTVTVEPGAVNADQAWYLCLKTSDPTVSSAEGVSKPIGDLQWSLDGTTWTSVAVGTQVLKTQAGPAALPVYMRLLLRYADDAPGTYGPATLTFQVSH